MLVRYKIELAYAKHRAYAQQLSPPLYYDPIEDLQNVDNIHKLQEHVPRSANVSEGGIQHLLASLTYHDLLCASSLDFYLRQTQEATSAASHRAHCWPHSVP